MNVTVIMIVLIVLFGWLDSQMAKRAEEAKREAEWQRKWDDARNGR